MKKFKIELRKLIASYLVMWAFEILPTGNEFKLRLANFLKKNIDQL